MARNNKEKSPFDIFLEELKQEYAETFGKPKANKHQGDDLSWEEFLVHELFRTQELLQWYEEIEDDDDNPCGCNECGCN
jgi:hypothetical protein